MTSETTMTPGGTLTVPPRHPAAPGGQPGRPDRPGRITGPLGLTPVQLPPGLAMPHRLAGAAVVSYTQALLLAWAAGHPGAERQAAINAVRRHHGQAASRAAYDRLVTDGLLGFILTPGRHAHVITMAGTDALSRARLAAWNARHDLAAWDTAWEHPANGSQRWALACHTGMRLLGFPYSNDDPPEACLLAAWDAMGPAAGLYLASASLPLLLGLLGIALCGPVPLATAAQDVIQWAAWCGKTRAARESRTAIRQIRAAAGVGLVQVGPDPWPPDGEAFREIVGPAAGWTVLAPGPAPGPDMHVVEG